MAQLQTPEEAIKSYSEASRLFRTSHDAYGEGIALYNIARLYSQLGDVRSKEEYASRALEVLEPLQGPAVQLVRSEIRDSSSSD